MGDDSLPTFLVAERNAVTLPEALVVEDNSLCQTNGVSLWGIRHQGGKGRCAEYDMNIIHKIKSFHLDDGIAPFSRFLVRSPQLFQATATMFNLLSTASC